MKSTKYYLIFFLLLSINQLFAQKKSIQSTNKGKIKEEQKTEVLVDKEIVLVSDLDRVSYSLGINIGTNIKTQGVSELNLDAFMRAIQDIFTEKTPQITNESASKVIQAYFIQIQQEKTQNKKQKALDLLAENAKKPDVKTLNNGLQYTILKQGNGTKLQLNERALVIYHCTSMDGSILTSTFNENTNTPIVTNLDHSIKGINEALLNMTVGAKWKVLIPYELAYGENGNNGKPGPYENLQLIIELIAIQ